MNRLKDCDVTWLYGPLSSGEDKVSVIASPASPQSPQRIQSLTCYPNIKKPILKKRSMSEVMLQRSLSSSSLLQQAAEVIQSQQSERPKPSRPQLAVRAHSDFSTYPFTYIRDSQVNTNNLPSALSSGCNSPSYQKHIHFNNRVEQCIAVDKADDDNDGDYENIDDLDDCDDDSSEDGLVMSSRSKGSARSSTRGSFSEHQTIAMLPSTTLKSVDEGEQKSSISSGIVSFISSSLGAGSKPMSGTTTPSSTVQSNFLVDEDDEDMDWEPNAFANRRDSIAIARPKFDMQEGDRSGSGTDSDEDEEVAGLFGRAVDAVNTARDIAHVLWNVGWRK